MNKNTFNNIGAVLVALITIGTFSLGADSETGAIKTMPQNNESTITKDLVVTRTFDAPVDEVWRYWADSEKVKQWWGPKGFTTPVAEMDFREGGASLVCMRAPKEFGGQDMYNIWTYTKILPMERIEFILNFADKDGNKHDPAKMGMPPGIPKDVRHVVTFKAVGDNKTEMTVTEYGYASDQVVEMSKQGLEQCLDKMAAALAKHVTQTKKENDYTQASQQSPKPSADLKSLNRLVGTWKVSGEAQGQISYEWKEGGFFLVQHFDLLHGGRKIKGIEIIGHLQRLGEEPSKEIRTRVYSFLDGLTLDYVYELVDNTLTIWGGEKGSLAYYKGKFSDDGNTLTGGWVWPGGGYKTTSTRVK